MRCSSPLSRNSLNLYMVFSGLGAQPPNAKLPRYSCKLGCEASAGAEAGAEAKAEAGAEPVGFSAETKARTRFFQAVPHNGFSSCFSCVTTLRACSLHVAQNSHRSSSLDDFAEKSASSSAKTHTGHAGHVLEAGMWCMCVCKVKA